RNVSELQYLKKILAGLPVSGYRPRFAIVLQCGRKAGPLDLNVADKIRIPGAFEGAALFPVEDEFGDGVLDKIRVDPRLAAEQVEGVFGWSPTWGHGDFAAALGAAGLLFSPQAQHMF